jgi:hypothetical protein
MNLKGMGKILGLRFKESQKYEKVKEAILIH